MDKKSKELIKYDNINSKNANNLEGLHEKAEKTLKDQKSKSVSNISKEKVVLKAKEREEKKVLKNNFFEKHKNEKTVESHNNKFAVVYSKKAEYNNSNNRDYLMQPQKRISDSEAYERINDNQENLEDLNASDNDNENNYDDLNIEQTKRQNFITQDLNHNPNNTSSNNKDNSNFVKAKAKPKSLPKDQYELKQEIKLKKNNFLENQKKFAANLMEQNIKKMREQQQQANKVPKTESPDDNKINNITNTNNINNKEKLFIAGRKPTSQNTYNTNANYNNNNNQNKSRMTNTNEKSHKFEQINKILTTEEKLENIEKINECFEKLEIKKVERESMDKIKKKVVLVQKKLRVLQEKGIEVNFDESNNNNENNEDEVKDNTHKGQNAENCEEYEQEEEKNYVFHDSDNNVEKEDISSKNFISNSENDNKNNNLKKNIQNNNYDLNFENISKIKNSQINNYNNNQNTQHYKKPVVDTLEFVKKIQESRRKYASKSPGKSELLNRSDSFRRSNSESNNNNQNNNNIINIRNNNKINDYEADNNHHSNNKLLILTNKLLSAANDNNGEADIRRKDVEIKQFIERKKKEKKMVELKIQEENRKNWENKVLQLLQLEKTIITKNEKVNYVKKNNNSSAQNYSRQSNSANKVRNDFYIGTKKPNLNNNNLDESSILDPDDFYYTVLESKNIIVTQKSQSSNKINSVSVKNSNKSTANELNYNFNFKTSDDFQKQNAVSRLSDFTQGNLNDNRKSDYNYNFTNNTADNRKVSNITNKVSQENFLKFINENEKITMRSIDSKNSGNNIINSNNNNTHMKQALKNINNNNISSNSPSNLKLTIDSKLIGSKSSNFNPAMRKSDNLFENNLENNAKKQHQQQQIQSQLKKNSNIDIELSNSPGFEASSAAKKSQKLNENQAEISDLNNKNNLSERLIDRSDIEKDSFLLQFDNLLMTFANKIKHVYLRKHLSELINNIIIQEQLEFCYETLRGLCNVGKRSVFNRLKEHASEVHVENIYSVFNNVTLFAKRNAMKRIFQYFAFVRNLEEESESNLNNNDNNNNNYNEENYRDSDLDEYENLDTKKIEEIKSQYLTYFVGIINRLFLIQKKDAIERIFEYAKNFSLYNDLNFSGREYENAQRKHHASGTKSSLTAESLEESEYSEQEKIAKYYDYIKSTFDLMTRHIRKDAYFRIKAFSAAKKHRQIKSNESNRSSCNNNYINIDNNSSINSERHSEKIVLSKKSANGDKSFSSVFNQNKANSFIAQSHNSSNFSLHPNSLDSPKIRKLQFKIAQKNMEREWLDNIDQKYGNNNSNDFNSNNNNGNASSAKENKSNTSFSNNYNDNNLNLDLDSNSNNIQIKDNPLVRSEDENEESKNINFSKLSIDDPFKDSKKKFYDAAIANENDNKPNEVNNYNINNKNSNNNNDNSRISHSNMNNSLGININKYSTLNYNDDLSLNLESATGEAERKKPVNNETSQIQHNNRYGSNNNENSSHNALSKKKNNDKNTNKNSSPKFDDGADGESSLRRETEEKNQNQISKKDNLSKDDEKISHGKNTVAFDAAGNLKFDNNLTPPDKPKNEKESIHDDILEDIVDDNFDVFTSNRKKNSSKEDASGRFLGTDIDLSADRDNTSDIDWIYSVSQSKSGSLRDVTGGNLVKQFTDLTSKNEDNYKNKAKNLLNNEKEEKNNFRDNVSIGFQSDNNNNNKKPKNEFSYEKNMNNNSSIHNKKGELESKIKEMQIDPAARKTTEEDYENNYDDFDNIEEDIVVDDEADLAKILGEDSTSNVQHGSLLKSRNSLKNGSSLQEEKEKEKQKEYQDTAKNKILATEDLKKGYSQNTEEKEIDLTNKKVNLNIIPGKETIESVKDVKSIESDDNDFFKIKNNNNNQNILNLLDDKSSNNKSVNMLSHLSPDMGLISDGTSSYNFKEIQLNKDTINTDYLAALDKKSENNTITSSLNNRKQDIAASKESILLSNNVNSLVNHNKEKENNAVNKRYESIAKKSDVLNSYEKEYLTDAEMDSISAELAEKIMIELIKGEVKDCEKNLIPKKIFKSEAGLVNMLNSLNSTPLNRSMVSLDNSTNSTINNTLFSKTVLELKKENSMKLYIEHIGPKLIGNIVQDITKSNYLFVFIYFSFRNE